MKMLLPVQPDSNHASQYSPKGLNYFETERRLLKRRILTCLYICVRSFKDLVLKYGRGHTFIVAVLEFILHPICNVTLKQLLEMWPRLHAAI
jgi:hypothetical protein